MATKMEAKKVADEALHLVRLEVPLVGREALELLVRLAWSAAQAEARAQGLEWEEALLTVLAAVAESARQLERSRSPE